MPDEDVEAYFGSTVRNLLPGTSFGELALLQKTAVRTASVLVPPHGEAKDTDAKSPFAEENTVSQQMTPQRKSTTFSPSFPLTAAV
eukprot:scaffold313637_cov28-Prasinocladus_malaysianus.AAC.1